MTNGQQSPYCCSKCSNDDGDHEFDSQASHHNFVDETPPPLSRPAQQHLDYAGAISENLNHGEQRWPTREVGLQLTRRGQELTSLLVYSLSCLDSTSWQWRRYGRGGAANRPGGL